MEKRDLERDVNQKTDGTENITETDGMRKFAHLWVPCENCYNLHYKKCFNAARICEKCGIHLRMNSWDRLELLIDEGTWIPMDEDMVSRDPIEFDREVFYEKINYKEFLKEFMGYYSKNSVFVEILNNTDKDKEEDRENDKFCFKCGIDRPDYFEELHEGEISPFQIFFGCAKYDTRDSGFFEECAKKGRLSHFETSWILSKYYKSDEDAFRKFFSKNYEPYFKDDELCSEAFETEFNEKLLGNNAIEIYYFNKSCENICSISPLFYKLFFENRVDLPRLEKFFSNFGIDLSEFFESFPKHEMDCLKFCQEAGSLGIGFSLLSDSCEKQISYDYLDLAFFRKIPKSVSGIYKFLEECYKNKLDLFFLFDEIQIDIFFIFNELVEKYWILPRLSKLFSRYKLGMRESFEGNAENNKKGIAIYESHKKYFFRDQIDFSKDSSRDHSKDSKDPIDFARDSKENIDHIDPDSTDDMDPGDYFHNPTDLDPAKYSSADLSVRRDSNDLINDIYYGKASKEHIDHIDPDSTDDIDWDFRDDIDWDGDCRPRTALDLDPDKDSSGYLLGQRDSRDLIHPIDFARDSREHIDHVDPDSTDDMGPDDDFQTPTDLDPAKDSSADSFRDQIDFPKDSSRDHSKDSKDPIDFPKDSSRDRSKDSKDPIDWDEDCRPRTALDQDKDSSGDLLGRRVGNENEEGDGYCQNPPGHDPDKGSSGDPARPMDDISVYKEEEDDDINVYKEEEDPLVYILRDSEDVTYPVKKDISEKEKEEESADSSDSSGLEGKCYRDHMDLFPKESGLEEISEKDKEGSKMNFDWDEFIETFYPSAAYVYVHEFEGVFDVVECSKKEEESKEEESKEEESKEEESKEEESKEEESKEEESKEEESKEEESKEEESKEEESKEEESKEEESKEEESPIPRKKSPRKKSPRKKKESKEEESPIPRKKSPRKKKKSKEEESPIPRKKSPRKKKESKEEESPSPRKKKESKEEEYKKEEFEEFIYFEPEDDEEFIYFEPEDDEEEDINYIDYYDSYQDETGLPEAIQTGIGELNGIPLAIGVMDFGFIGGSMGAVVGEKITRLIEYATKNSLPLIIVCASGGARMQEGIVSLMQMAKISSALYDYHHKPVEKKLLYISILASPTSGGVTASFGMLGDIIIAEPDAEIAFAGKRVIEEVLKEEVPEGAQTTENLFEKGLFDPVLPRNLLKSALSELLELHGFFPLNKTQAKH